MGAVFQDATPELLGKHPGPGRRPRTTGVPGLHSGFRHAGARGPARVHWSALGARQRAGNHATPDPSPPGATAGGCVSDPEAQVSRDGRACTPADRVPPRSPGLAPEAASLLAAPPLRQDGAAAPASGPVCGAPADRCVTGRFPGCHWSCTDGPWEARRGRQVSQVTHPRTAEMPSGACRPELAHLPQIRAPCGGSGLPHAPSLCPRRLRPGNQLTACEPSWAPCVRRPGTVAAGHLRRVSHVPRLGPAPRTPLDSGGRLAPPRPPRQ